jgi:hypothetical protein
VDNTGARALGACAIVSMLLMGAIGSRTHQRYWQNAAVSRDLLLDVAGKDGRLLACGTIAVLGLPDRVDGAYLFRNGADIALPSRGLTLTPAAPAACTFRWDQASAAFVPSP